MLAIFKEDSPWNLLAQLTVACKVHHLYSACQVRSAVRLNLDHDNSVLKGRMNRFQRALPTVANEINDLRLARNASLKSIRETIRSTPNII